MNIEKKVLKSFQKRKDDYKFHRLNKFTNLKTIELALLKNIIRELKENKYIEVRDLTNALENPVLEFKDLDCGIKITPEGSDYYKTEIKFIWLRKLKRNFLGNAGWYVVPTVSVAIFAIVSHFTTCKNESKAPIAPSYTENCTLPMFAEKTKEETIYLLDHGVY